MKRSRFLFCCFFMLMAATATISHADLHSYIGNDDASFKWSAGETRPGRLASVTDINLTSQTWQGLEWKHVLRVYQPQSAEFPDAAVLFITGGSNGSKPGRSDDLLGAMLASRMAMTVAVLHHTPNQPLYDNLREDALIAHTFVKYLDGGNDDWPLLFPMTKSAVRAMDALQAYSRERNLPTPKRFIVTGASKRGWTTWLTAATGDKRVAGIAPMVIDTLNMPAQMPHQLEMWGKYSSQIDDYTRSGIQERLKTPRGKQLTAWVDPYAYRKKLTLPKFIINGTNDPYWTQDALNLYWDGLKGPKWVLYAPNSGHGLDDRGRVMNALISFCRSVAAKKPLPKQTWRYESTKEGVRLVVSTPGAVLEARLWVASSQNLDFRESEWTERPVKRTKRGFQVKIARPQSGNLAVFGEAQYQIDGLKTPLSTQIRILKSTPGQAAKGTQ